MNEVELLSKSNDNEKILKTRQQELISLLQIVSPHWFNEIEVLEKHTEQTPENYLDSFYLFPVHEISVYSNCTDIPKYINERFQSLLSAAYQAGFCIALIISGKNGKVEIFVGFKNPIDKKPSPQIFESIINGFLPGKKIKLKETISLSSLAKDYLYGGIITGIPFIKKEYEKRRFKLSSVIRGLYGHDYLLAVISTPVDIEKQKQILFKLLDIKNELHKLARQTISKARERSESVSETKTEGYSQTVGGGVAGGVGGGAFISIFLQISATKSTSEGKTTTVTEGESHHLSFEQINSLVLELEKITDLYIERIQHGLQTGLWETLITFAAKDETACDILGGTFVGELSIPTDRLLLPPRVFKSPLKGRPLFIPKPDSYENFIPPLISFITSEELSIVSSPPAESVPGYEIQKVPELSLNDISSDSGIILGYIVEHGKPISDNYLYLSKNDINKHLFVCGITGSGKTTTIKHILKALAKEGIPFLVLESAKRDYRQLLADDIFKNNLNIFTIGEATISPIRFNPFYIQAGVHPLVHIDYLKAIFNVSFSLYGPMPSIVEKCLHTIYIKKGWDLTKGTHPYFINSEGIMDDERYQHEEHFYCFPTLADLKNEVEHYINTELDYKGELRDNIRTAILVRLESLCVGTKGLMFNTYDFFPIEKLLTKNTVIEMEGLADDDDKAFFMGLILTFISEYRRRKDPAINPGGDKKLSHFLVIEEAHRLLKNVETERKLEMLGNPKGKAVEMFCNLLSEMRSMGQGIAVVEQIPSKILPDVIKNSNTKIVHRLVSKDDQLLLAGSLGIDDIDALYLAKLQTGYALCYKEGMGRPVECAIINDVQSHAISNKKVKELMMCLEHKSLHREYTYEIDNLLGKDGKTLAVQFFNSLILQSAELEKLVSIAQNKLQKSLIHHNIPYKVDNLLFSDYFTLEIIKLLSKGIYCRNYRIPIGLKSLLYNILETFDKDSENRLMNMLSTFWESPPKDYIEEVIKELVIEYLIKYKYEHAQQVDLPQIKKIVSSYLLVKDEDAISRISQKVKNKVGIFNG